MCVCVYIYIYIDIYIYIHVCVCVCVIEPLIPRSYCEGSTEDIGIDFF